MLHTTLTEVTDNLPIDSIPLSELPSADYYALGHIHVDFEGQVNEKPAVYGGPTFPNNFKELEELKHGSFYIVDVRGFTKIMKKELPLKEVLPITLEITNSLIATQQIINVLENHELKDKIVLLRLYGALKQGKMSDIKFQEIQDYLDKKGTYSFLKNTTKLEVEKKEMEIQIQPHEMEKIEEVLIRNYGVKNPSDFNKMIFPLMEALTLEKQEGEKTASFEQRLFSGLGKILGVEMG